MKAYWIAHVTVTDPDRYAEYRTRAAEVFAAHGARFLARGGESDVPEGPELSRHVVIEFPSLEAARACYASPAYQQAKTHRDGASVAHVVLVEGC